MGKGKLILVGSSNPTKINAVKQAFHLVYPKMKFKVIGKTVSSGVSDQPMGEKETFLGANNRVLGLLKEEANYYVGIEGGCCFIDKKLYAFAWVITRDDKKVGCGKTSLFQLPRKIQNLVETGVELGEADDIVFGRKNSKRKDGAVGILTGGLVDRTRYYKEAVLMSLIPFINSKLSFS